MSQGNRVLVVDDDRITSRAWTDILKLRGFNPVAVVSVTAAVDLLSKEHFDAVILDLVLADGSGRTVADFIAEKKIESRLIVCTGRPEMAGSVKYLFIKPVDVDAVIQLLQ